MNRKNFKRFAAASLAATMAFGSAMTVFAEGEDTTPAAGVAEGTGSYEGGEMKYPTLSVTLPTIPAGTYDYIADPNGLIAATNTAKYEDSTFTGTTGLFFLTSKTDAGAKTYTEKSAALTLANENAQDLDVTVKLEQKTAGNSIIQYASSATFDADDTANKLYLAVTDGETDPNEAALSANGAAVVKTTVAGVPDNYEAGYDETDGYQYVKKADDALADWNDCSFMLTGAVNKNATWGEDIVFPEIKVTWSYKEHTDAYLDSLTMTASSTAVTATLPEGVTVSKVELFKVGVTTPTAMVAGSHYTKSGDTYTFKADMVSKWSGATIKFTYSNGNIDEVIVQ